MAEAIQLFTIVSKITNKEHDHLQKADLPQQIGKL
jgi:hypothetical protein